MPFETPEVGQIRTGHKMPWRGRFFYSWDRFVIVVVENLSQPGLCYKYTKDFYSMNT